MEMLQSGGEDLATNGEIKSESKTSEGTAPAAKNRKRNGKGAQKLNSVNGEPAAIGGHKEAEEKIDVADKTQKIGGELDVKKETAVAQGPSIVGETTTASMGGGKEVATDSNAGPKKKRKRNNKKKKAAEAPGTPQNTVREDGSPAKTVKIESMKEEIEKEKVMPVAEISTENNAPRLSKAQRRKKRKKKIREAIAALRMSKMAPQNENTTITTTSTITQEPGTQGNNNAKKRKLNDANGTLASVSSGQQNSNIKTEDVPTKKIKTESTEGSHNPQKEGTNALNNERPAKKKKRKKKKPAQNKNTILTATTTLGGEPGTQGEDNTKKRKLNEADSSLASVSSSNQNNVQNGDVPTKKMRTEAAEGNQDSQEVAITNVNNEGPAKKKRRRKKKKKQNVAGDSTSIESKESQNKEKMDPKNDETTKVKPSQGEITPTPKKKKKKNRKKKKNNENKQDGSEAAAPNAMGSEQSNVHTALTQQTATSAVAKGTQDKEMQRPVLHPSCASADNKKRIAKRWKDDSKKGLVIADGMIEVIKDPFTCCYIPHLLQDEAYLDGVKKELENVELLTKNNDLYKFRQTGDLKGITSPLIAGLRHLLYTDVRQWLIDVTGIPLSDTVDMGSSRYSHTDMLLCHDDELEGRRIAYILYLVPPWGPEDGGTLDLFATDGDGHPSDIVKSLIPKNNAFAFFEVSPVSFHQVSEVLSRDKTRLSINGWFHGPPVPRPKRNPPPPSPLQGPTDLEEEDFYAWINPMYLDTKIQKEIRQKFCSESELELENFLTDEAYERLSKAFMGEGLAWQHTGPADRQRYEILGPDSMPQDVKECRQFLGCEAMFLVLSQLTGLKLHSLAPEDSDDEEKEKEEEASGEPNPQCHAEAQRWGPGCYTLIRDDCVDSCSALDAFLYTNVSQQWTQQLGGHVTYIAKDEDEELLTVVPQSNCLCLVYRDAQTLRFTKYITSAARDLGADNSHFHNFACTYYE